MKHFFLFLSLSWLLLESNAAFAQSFRYMDEAGNLHWADSLEEVPRQYRNQILAPTPVPTYKKGHAPRPPKPAKTRKPRPTPKPRKRPPGKSPKIERATFAPDPTVVAEVPAPSLMPPGIPPAKPSDPPLSSVSIQTEVAFEGAVADASMAIVAKP